jgi:hypothetical protein
MSEQQEPVLGQTANKVKQPDSKGLGGRPPKLTKDEKVEVYNALEKYILDTNDPTLPDFVTSDEVALRYHVTKYNLQDWQEFSSLIKQCVAKQEAYLLKEAGKGTYNPTLAIFRLKQPQHGYRDRFESDITSNGKDVGVGLTATQAEQLLRLRADRVDSD